MESADRQAVSVATLPGAADEDFRYERKYFLDFLSPSEVELLVKIHPCGFRKSYPDRYINNIYLDTPTFRCYRENEAGITPRMKYRVRWYGDLHQPAAAAVFELKRKFGFLGDKIRFDLGPFDTLRTIAQRGVRELFDAPGDSRPFLGHANGMRCVLVNRYLRRYYATSDGLFRITIDREIQFFPFRAGHSTDRSFVSERAVIVEIKYGREQDVLARRVTENFPFRPTRISKYVYGVDQLRSRHLA